MILLTTSHQSGIRTLVKLIQVGQYVWNLSATVEKPRGLYEPYKKYDREMLDRKWRATGYCTVEIKKSTSDEVDIAGDSHEPSGAWNKPEKAEEWRAKLSKTEAVEE